MMNIDEPLRRQDHSDTIMALAIDVAEIKGQNALLIDNSRKVDVALNMISETLQAVASEKIRVDSQGESIDDLKDNQKYLFGSCVAVVAFAFGYLYLLIGASETRLDTKCLDIKDDLAITRGVLDNHMKSNTDEAMANTMEHHKIEDLLKGLSK